MNLPNYITLSRIAAVPVLIWILSPKFPFQNLHGEQEIIASVVFILASITDGLDGYLARRRGQITTLGMLLDPLADKLLVTAAYIVLVSYNPRVVVPWIAVLVIGREFLVSGLRSIAASEGFTIEASEIGKLKTVIQIVSVVAAILNHRWDYWNFGGFVVGGAPDCRDGDLLDGNCVDHLGGGLLRRLLEEDRPRERPAAETELGAEPQEARGAGAGREYQAAVKPACAGDERASAFAEALLFECLDSG